MEETLFELTEQLKEEAKNANINALSIAAKLYLIQEKKLYRDTDMSVKWSFEGWMAQSEIPLGYSTAREWIRIYKKIVQDAGYEPKQLAEIAFNKLRLVASVEPLLLPEAITKAKALSTSDLKLELKNADECQHEPERVIIVRCKKCGIFLKKEKSDVPVAD